MKQPKRTIESLKPNECIHIRTEKEAHRISKKLSKAKIINPISRAIERGYLSHEKGFLLDPHGNGFGGVSSIYNTTHKVIPASDFISKKKSKTAKRLDRVERRIQILEEARYAPIRDKAKEIAKKYWNELLIQDIKIFNPFEIEQDRIKKSKEIKENIEQKPFVLPEKWCVKDCREVSKYAIEKFGYLSDQPNYNWWLHSDGDFYSSIQPGYTEITTEQFIEHVLKREAKDEYVKNAIDSVNAALIEQPKEIDFSIAGQLVEYDGLVVETTGLHYRDEFSGFIKKECLFPVGHTSNTWVKERFKLYTGEPITLKNN